MTQASLPPNRLPPGAWLRRLDRLWVKLFLAIAGANVALVMTASLIYSASFDQGLVEYLNRADESRLTPLVTRLADGHRQYGGWGWITEDRQRWQDLVREVLGVGRMPRRPPGEAGRTEPAASAPSAPSSAPSASSAPGLPPPAGPADPKSGPPLTIDPRLLLLDERREVILGPAERVGQAVLRPIESLDKTVGYLGYIPRLQMVASLEQIFLTQQNRKFAAIAVGLLAAVLLNAALIAHWLSRRLRVLREGTTGLTRGEYHIRIPAHGHDELAQLAADFNRLAQALEAAQKTRQQWIADIAHELRTPLASLRAEIEAMEDGVRPLSQEGVSSLGQEVVQLTRLVEDLRLLSLSDVDALSYYKEPLDLKELLEDFFVASRPACQTHRLAVRMDLASQVQVLGDESRLTQVFSNLLQNTLRYSEAPATLSLQLRARGTEALLVWEDSAPGVPEADLPRLTQRLFRVDASRARASGGSGLGLAIVEAIIDGHGGRMTPSPSAQGGLRWDIVLPLMPPAEHHG